MINDNKCKLNIDMRKLFSDYIINIREYVISSTEKIDNLQYIIKRLEQNCLDLGTFVGSIYGTYNGKRFTELFTDYLSYEITFINSTIGEEVEKSVSDKLEWYMGTVHIIEFFSAIDNFDRSDLRDIFFSHLHLMENYVIVRIRKSYSEDIKVFDNLYDQTMLMADILSNVIVSRL